MAIGTYGTSPPAVNYQVVSNGVTYNYSEGGSVGGSVTSYGITIYSSTGSALCTYTSSGDISTEVSNILGVLQANLTDLQKSYATEQNTLARLQKELQDPNLTPEQRAAKQQDITDFQNDVMAKTQTQINETQSAISTIQSSASGIYQGMVETWNQNQPNNTAKPEAPTTGAAAPAPAANTTPGLAGAASDDSGAGQPKPAGSTGGPVTSPAAAAGAGGTTPTTAQSTANSGSVKTGVAPSGTNTPANAGTGSGTETKANAGLYKFQSSIISTQSVATASQPGKRLQNPLGEFSSYTYQITLYMITPDAYEAFVAGGRKKINVLSEASAGSAAGGAFVIAQSGGINKSSDKRAPGFEYDYGIDNLSIKHMMTGKSTGSATTISEMSFNISEPYGFSFLSNLRKASDAIAEYSKGLTKKDINPARQFFILGIRFLGYDASGRPMMPNTKLSTGSGVVDPLSQTGSLFEHFYDITIYSVKFKIDGKMVTYQCKATAAGPGKGFSTTRGFIQTQKTVEADTVGVAIDKLITQLNTEQTKLSEGTPPSLRYPNKYEIIWLPGTEEILNASIISKARFEKYHWGSSGAKTSAESNAANDVKNQTAKDNYKQLTFNDSTPIVQAINTIIMQSSYLEDALSVVYTSAPEANPDTKSQPAIKPAYQKKKVSWYNCHPQITEIKWDDLTKDWSYKISYLIQKYETPVVDTPMVESGKTYPGPHKRYDYWYTGENREIINYEQVMDNAYYNTVVSAGQTTAAQTTTPAGSGPQPNATGGATSQTPSQPNMKTNQPTQGSTGYGFEAQNSYLTALYDPGAYATAKITILGDPDFLSEDPVYSEEQIYDQFYGSNGFSLNANGGQVFIEIDFKEAIDYSSSGSSIAGSDGSTKISGAPGTLSINNSILFWKYPDSISKKIKGVSYFVTSCTSTFSNGIFKQVLDCNINDFGDTSQIKNANEGAAAQAREDDALAQKQASASGDKTGETPGDSNTTSADTSGTKTEKPVDTTNTVQTPTPAPTPAKEA